MEDRSLPVGSSRDDRHSATCDHLVSQSVRIIPLSAGTTFLRTSPRTSMALFKSGSLPGTSRTPISFPRPLATAPSFGFLPPLVLAEALCLRVSTEVAGVLVDLDVGRVDDLEPVPVTQPDRLPEQRVEDPLLRPPPMEAIDGVPLSVALGELVPLAPGHKNPPDPTQRFEKIGGRTALFQNARPPAPGVKLIFHVLEKHVRHLCRKITHSSGRVSEILLNQGFICHTA